MLAAYVRCSSLKAEGRGGSPRPNNIGKRRKKQRPRKKSGRGKEIDASGRKEGRRMQHRQKMGRGRHLSFFGALRAYTLVGAPPHMCAWEKWCEEWPGGVMVKRRVGGNYGTLGKPSHWNGMPLGSGRLFGGRRRREKEAFQGWG